MKCSLPKIMFLFIRLAQPDQKFYLSLNGYSALTPRRMAKGVAKSVLGFVGLGSVEGLMSWGVAATAAYCLWIWPEQQKQKSIEELQAIKNKEFYDGRGK
ncbi:hypothetical protein CYMTET_50413 [Cymbomonas tetramitiformis]|uniref:Uncharacterized protein n=1 Tax=Cymbomonas tetramitiformis TaxID=36881 RepID=A0AAE0BN43_9CHLO|nr:hypothetical protein CYMTET_50413 [Cymbomonas tetramitiformis]